MKTIETLDNGIEIRSVPADAFEELTTKQVAEIFDDSQRRESENRRPAPSQFSCFRQRKRGLANSRLKIFRDPICDNLCEGNIFCRPRSALILKFLNEKLK